jgi:hypothetical protein
VVVDGTQSSFGASVADSLNSSGAFQLLDRVPPRAGLIDSLTGAVSRRQLDGFLIVTDATVDSGVAEYRSSNVSSLRDIGVLKGVLGRMAVNARLERAGVDPQVVREAQLQVALETRKISGSTTTGESSAQSFTLAYVMAIHCTWPSCHGERDELVLEEKMTRCVLVSSLRPSS